MAQIESFTQFILAVNETEQRVPAMQTDELLATLQELAANATSDKRWMQVDPIQYRRVLRESDVAEANERRLIECHVKEHVSGVHVRHCCGELRRRIVPPHE